MKRIIIAMLVILLFVSCNKTDNIQDISVATQPVQDAVEVSAEISDDTEEEYTDDSELTESDLSSSERFIKMNHFESFNILRDEGANYEVYTDKYYSGYEYRVTDNSGNLIDWGYHGYKGKLEFDTVGDILSLHYGSGTFVWYDKYYHIDSGRVSRLFWKVNAVSPERELVAYFDTNEAGEIALVVQNMFDPAQYYHVISREFTTLVMSDHCEAEFLENGTKLKMTYWTGHGEGAEYEDVQMTEVFDLP